MSTPILKRITVRDMTHDSSVALDGLDFRALAVVIGKINGRSRQRAYTQLTGMFQLTRWNGTVFQSSCCDLPNLVLDAYLRNDVQFILRLNGVRCKNGIEYVFDHVKPDAERSHSAKPV